MDVLTQGLLGGVMAQTAANAAEKRLATLAGIAAGLLADADVFIRSARDPLLNIEYHRHFTHSVFFVPIGAALAFVILWPFLRRHLANGRLYLFCLLGFSLSGLLDACTSYGTKLFWPVSDERIAFNIISIVDPVFTLILLVTLLLGLRIRRRSLAAGGLSLAALYLLMGFMQMQRAEDQAVALAAQRGHESPRLVVKPTLGNLILWRSVYVYDERIYVDAIRVGLTGKSVVYEGSSVKRFEATEALPSLASSSVLYKDIRRFVEFSDEFVALSPSQDNVLGDIRYSMLPNSIEPLWGIVIEPSQPQQHADYRFFRENSQQVRDTFINMLLGRCDAAQC